MDQPMNGLLRPDDYWDKTNGGGIRCSSEGQDACLYHDTAAVGGFEQQSSRGRSIASLMPSHGMGIRGVVIPRATIYGGSRGFNAQRPRLMNVDPDIKGQSSVVDVGALDKEVVRRAYELAWQQVGEYGDHRIVAAQAYRNLAISSEPLSEKTTQVDEARLPPIAGINAYVVPRAGLGGGQIVHQPKQLPTGAIGVSLSVEPGAAPPPPVDKQSVLTEMDLQTKAKHRQAAAAASEALRTVSTMRPAQLPEMPAIKQAQVVTEVPMQPQPQLVQQFPVQQPIGYPQQQMQQQPMPLQQHAPQMQSGFRDQTTTPGMYAPSVAVPVQQNPVQHPLLQMPTQPQGGAFQAATLPYVMPTCEVLFEMEGWGQMPAAYHAVIRNNTLLVLKWDKRCPTGRYFPPNTDKPIAMVVKGQDKVFQVCSTGSTFIDGDMEYCILVVAKELNRNGNP